MDQAGELGHPGTEARTRSERGARCERMDAAIPHRAQRLQGGDVTARRARLAVTRAVDDDIRVSSEERFEPEARILSTGLDHVLGAGNAEQLVRKAPRTGGDERPE